MERELEAVRQEPPQHLAQLSLVGLPVRPWHRGDVVLVGLRQRLSALIDAVRRGSEAAVSRAGDDEHEA